MRRKYEFGIGDNNRKPKTMLKKLYASSQQQQQPRAVHSNRSSYDRNSLDWHHQQMDNNSSESGKSVKQINRHSQEFYTILQNDDSSDEAPTRTQKQSRTTSLKGIGFNIIEIFHISLNH